MNKVHWEWDGKKWEITSLSLTIIINKMNIRSAGWKVKIKRILLEILPETEKHESLPLPLSLFLGESLTPNDRCHELKWNGLIDRRIDGILAFCGENERREKSWPARRLDGRKECGPRIVVVAKLEFANLKYLNVCSLCAIVLAHVVFTTIIPNFQTSTPRFFLHFRSRL